MLVCILLDPYANNKGTPVASGIIVTTFVYCVMLSAPLVGDHC